MAKKNVSFRVFLVKNDELTQDRSDLKDELLSRLKNSKVEQRLISLFEKDPETKDLLASYAPSGNSTADYFYGLMMRLKPASGISAIPDNYLQQAAIDEDELNPIAGMEGKVICSSLYHFFVKGKYLITDLPGNTTIAGFSGYLDKYLLTTHYAFAPFISPNRLELKDIKCCVFQDPLTALPEKEKRLSLKPNVRKLIQWLCPEVDNLNKIMKSNIVSAKMTLDFEKPKSMKQEDYANQLGAVLAPISDLENIYFTTNNGVKVMGEQLVYTTKRTLEGEKIDAECYIQAMKGVYEDLPKND